MTGEQAYETTPTEQECWNEFWEALAQSVVNAALRRAESQADQSWTAQRPTTVARREASPRVAPDPAAG